MTDQTSASRKKPPTIKDPSRITKSCHWCNKPEPVGQKFQLCGRCKAVCFCSKECQKQSWKLAHKHTCKDPAQYAKTPEQTALVAGVKRWHTANLDLIKKGYILALDLRNTPQNVTEKALVISLKARANSSKLPPDQKYFIEGTFDLTMEEARSIIVMRGGASILAAHSATHDHCVNKGGMGVGMVIIHADGLMDVLQIMLPKKIQVVTIDMDPEEAMKWRDMANESPPDDEEES